MIPAATENFCRPYMALSSKIKSSWKAMTEFKVFRNNLTILPLHKLRNSAQTLPLKTAWLFHHTSRAQLNLEWTRHQIATEINSKWSQPGLLQSDSHKQLHSLQLAKFDPPQAGVPTIGWLILRWPVFFSVCAFFFSPSLSSFMLRPSMCIYICNIYVIYIYIIYICIHTLWIYVYNYVLKFYGWVTISLELCSTHHVYCSNPHLCVGVWVGKLQWIAVNHVQCTFFSFVKLPFMHVWSTYFGLCSL